MKRLKFDSNGKLVSVDNSNLDSFDFKEKKEEILEELRSSDSLDFLKDYGEFDRKEEREFWSLYSNGKKLEPLKFTNGKTQEDVVKEVVNLIRNGKKIVFIHGVCGSGKSAMALNIARALGRASIVVPVKNLQKQYEEDYTKKKYLLKNGKKMKIAMITGRDNHDSLIKPGASCADPFLPDTIKIAEKNYGQIFDFYSKNPLIRNKNDMIDVRNVKRISIAPANPYWSPILSSDYEVPLVDAKKKKYKGLNNKSFIFYHRKQGCSYYDQYQAYIDADAIIFNSSKYLIENALDRKPATDVEIIDECDEFLDNFSSQEEINLTRLATSINTILPESLEAREIIDDIIEVIKLEEKNKQAIGVDEKAIYHIRETKVEKLIRLLTKNTELEAEILTDELNYTNKALEIAKEFKDFLEDTYVTFKKYENDLSVSLVSTNLSSKFSEIVGKNKAVVLMSGTLHSNRVLEDVYGMKDFEIVQAESYQHGTIEIHRTGKEIDCRYSNFKSGKHTREDYISALSVAMQKAKKPVLVHVNAFEDLPTAEEILKYNISNLMAKEKLIELQQNDKSGKLVSSFKSKEMDTLFSTKCSRGVDFPGDVCNSIIFTKYPNPNVNDTFWKVLQKTHPTIYWEFYRDKARREFLQRIYRALRSKEDHVYVLSADIRVVDAVREIQNGN